MHPQTRFGHLAPWHAGKSTDRKRNDVRGSLEPLEDRMMLSVVAWNIDEAQSSATIAIPDQPFELDDGMGTVYTGTLKVRNQSGGNNDPWSVGNSAEIAGTLTTEYTDGSSIEFLLGQSSVSGVNSGSYIPNPANWNGTDFGGSFATGPGVFGGRLFPSVDQVLGLSVTVGYFNFTDVLLDAGSTSLPISSGSFPANTIDIGIASATANVKGADVIFVGQILPDLQETVLDLLSTNQAATGTITSPDPVGQPNLRQLTLPILQDFSIELSPDTPPFTGTITGQIVATTELAPAFSSSVTGRHIFYNQSKYDGNTSGIAPADSAAIDSSKSAYLPGAGSPITPTSMTSYDKGINGIFVDITGTHGTLSLGDFQFAVSGSRNLANNTPSTWTAAPDPILFTVLSDTPTVGTDRIEFIWAGGAITNKYLEVTVEGNDAGGGSNTNTGLAATDTFYFGNLIGDDFIGFSATTFSVTGSDELAVRAATPAFNLPVTNILDFDKNSALTANDQIVSRTNVGAPTGGFLFRINIPGPPPPPPAGDGDSGIASALAARSSDAISSPSAPPWLIQRLEVAAGEPARAARPADTAANARAQSRAGNVETDSLAVDSALDDELLESLLG